MSRLPDLYTNPGRIAALAPSAAVLLLPVLASFFGFVTPDVAALLWLTALLPTLHLAYLFGWKGAAAAAGATVGIVTAVQLASTAGGLPGSPLLAWVLPVYLATATGIGWMAERLHRRASTGNRAGTPDPVTGLLGEGHVRSILRGEFSAARRGRALAIVLFDLEIRGSGSPRDERRLLSKARAEMGRILGSTTRRMNMSGTLGPSRFASILDGSDADGALIFAERVLQAFEASDSRGEGALTSAGIASFQSSMSDPDDLVSAAELALRRAHEAGGGCVRVFGQHSPTEPDRDGTPGDRSGVLDFISEAPPAVPGSFPADPGPWGEGRRLLLVEDETPLRTLIATHLGHRGFEVVEAQDASEGVTRLGEEFDAVVTDLRLPGSPGQDLVTASKARWPDTPVIVITGYRDAQLAASALNAGADRYLFKPFALGELSEHLKSLLTRRDRARAETKERSRRTELSPERSQAARAAILNGARALVQAVEVRDPFTKRHSERVAAYSIELLQALGPDTAGVEPDDLRLACELHDVGKIGVPDAILNKDGPLTPEEFKEIQEHPRVGRRILEPLLGDPLILAVTAWHHERWDGKGYPDRLAGEAIPLPARIVAIADSLDAMTSPRAYRAGLTWDEAVGQVRARAGSQFDPGLMPAFESALEAMRLIHERDRPRSPHEPGSPPEPGHPEREPDPSS